MIAKQLLNEYVNPCDTVPLSCVTDVYMGMPRSLLINNKILPSSKMETTNMENDTSFDALFRKQFCPGRKNSK